VWVTAGPAAIAVGPHANSRPPYASVFRLPATLAAVIARMDRKADDEPIFPPHGSRWWERRLRPIKKAAAKMARKGGGWHDFRRTVGSLLVQAGSRILAVSKILGHASVHTTAAYYAHLDAEAGREDLAVL